MKRKAFRKRILAVCAVLAAFASASSGWAQEEAFRVYRLWGKAWGSTCPACDDYVEERIRGRMLLEALPVDCATCAVYRVVRFRARGEAYDVKLAEDGGLITLVYGDPTAHVFLDLVVNGYQVSFSAQGRYRMGKDGWPLFFFPALDDWVSLGLVAVP